MQVQSIFEAVDQGYFFATKKHVSCILTVVTVSLLAGIFCGCISDNRKWPCQRKCFCRNLYFQCEMYQRENASVRETGAVT